MLKRTLILVVLSALCGGVLWAQNSDRPVRSTRTEAPARVPAISASGARTRPLASGASSPGIQSGATPTPIAGFGAPSRYGSFPIQGYGYNPGISTSNWYRCNYFVQQLMRDFRFLPGEEYLWRYAQGDSPLTQAAVTLALRDSTSAAHSLIQVSHRLDQLVASYERGEIDRDAFNQEVKATTRRIRNYAKKIRKDFYLGYLDAGTDLDVPGYESPASLADLKQLTNDLVEAAHGINGTLDGFVSRDLSHVVSVGDLQKPSADSLSKRVDSLAKLIEKSSARL